MSWERLRDGQCFQSPRPTRRRAPGVTDVGVAFFVIVTAVAAFALVAFLSGPAEGGELQRNITIPCSSDRADWTARLADGWAERPLLEGVTKHGGRAELFASADRTWSFVVTTPKGWACVYATGTGLGPAINLEPEGETR